MVSTCPSRYTFPSLESVGAESSVALWLSYISIVQWFVVVVVFFVFWDKVSYSLKLTVYQKMTWTSDCSLSISQGVRLQASFAFYGYISSQLRWAQMFHFYSDAFSRAFEILYPPLFSLSDDGGILFRTHPWLLLSHICLAKAHLVDRCYTLQLFAHFPALC